MSHHDAFSQVGLDVTAGRDAHAPPPVPRADTAFCVALLGDFGAGAAGDLRGRAAHLVDRDDLDAVLARVAPEVDVDLGPGLGTTRLRFAALDDFHPDRLYERLPLFAGLRETRRRLADPRTFADAAADLAPRDDAAADLAPRDDAAARSTSDVAGALAGGSLLDSILDASPDVAPRDEPGDLQAFIRQAVRPHLVPRPDPRQAELLASVDAAVEALLRAVLGHPRVRALEALWRGLDFLVRRVETGPALRLALFDVSRDALAADLAASDDARATGAHAMLAAAGDRLPEPAPWSVIAALHPFDPAADAPLLDRLARLGAALGAPVLAAATDAVAAPPPDDDEDDDDAPASRAPFAPQLDAPEWRALRRAPHARFLGLLAPGVALRQPYGAEEPCDVVRFEEIEPALDARAAADRVLWGSAALAGVALLAEAFAEDGWAMRPERHRELSRLAMVLHRHAGDTHAIPVARHALGDRETLRLVEGGVMPLAAARADDRALLARWQSVAEPASALAGRWAGAR